MNKSDWLICGGIKILLMSEYVKFPNFIAEWNRIDNDLEWVQEKWVIRKKIKG